MKQQAKVFRKATSDEQAIDIAHRIKVIDYELMRIVTGSNTGPNPLTGRLGSRAWRSCVAVAGWSDRRGMFEGWRITTYDKDRLRADTGERATIPAFTLGPMPDHSTWATTGEDPAILRRFGVIEGPDTDDDADRLTRMICAGRAESRVETEDGLPFNAGGFVQLAHLARGAAQTWIAHRWPEDVIGRPIDPAQGQPLPDQLMAHYDAQA